MDTIYANAILSKKKSLIEDETKNVKFAIDLIHIASPLLKPLEDNFFLKVPQHDFINPFISSRSFQNGIREELVRYHDVITLSQKYLLRNDSSGEGVFFLIRNTPNKGN